MGRRVNRSVASDERESGIDWEGAYDAYASDILRYLRRVTNDPATAEDLLQETFVHAIQASRQPSADGTRPWLFRIASNLALSYLRRQRLVRFIPLLSWQRAKAEPFDSDSEQVRRALRSIPPEQALCLTLALHEGFHRREIAAMLSTSEETIKSRLARGRRNFAAAYRRLDRGLAR